MPFNIATQENAALNDLQLVAPSQIQTFAAAGTLVVTGSVTRVSLSGTTYTVTLGTNRVPASGGNLGEELFDLYIVVEANTASGTVTFGGTSLLAGGIAPTLATTVTGCLHFVWDSAIQKWVFVRNA